MSEDQPLHGSCSKCRKLTQLDDNRLCGDCYSELIYPTCLFGPPLTERRRKSLAFALGCQNTLRVPIEICCERNLIQQATDHPHSVMEGDSQDMHVWVYRWQFVMSNQPTPFDPSKLLEFSFRHSRPDGWPAPAINAGWPAGVGLAVADDGFEPMPTLTLQHEGKLNEAHARIVEKRCVREHGVGDERMKHPQYYIDRECSNELVYLADMARYCFIAVIDRHRRAFLNLVK